MYGQRPGNATADQVAALMPVLLRNRQRLEVVSAGDLLPKPVKDWTRQPDAGKSPRMPVRRGLAPSIGQDYLHHNPRSAK
jgi:hypothetical protein